MEPNELRLGNYIYGADDTSAIQLTKEKLSLTLDHPSLAMPIPLTERWLEKFGFEKPDESDRYGGMLSPLINNIHRIRVKDNFWQSDYGDIELKYVHQLQNLFFALTGKELQL